MSVSRVPLLLLHIWELLLFQQYRSRKWTWTWATESPSTCSPQTHLCQPLAISSLAELLMQRSNHLANSSPLVIFLMRVLSHPKSYFKNLSACGWERVRDFVFARRGCYLINIVDRCYRIRYSSVHYLARARRNQFRRGVSQASSLTFSQLLKYYSRLSSSKPSRLITIGSTAGSRFEATTPNTIVEELLRIALRPCLLFVRWPAQPDNVLEEATRLSFTLQATQWINDLEAFLNEAAIMGDAVQSTQIHHWYRKTLGTLQTADRASFLFDPTRFLAGMLRHLHQTLLKVNHLDVNAVSRKGGPILIPVCFIRDWKENLLQEIHGNMSVIRNLLSMP